MKHIKTVSLLVIFIFALSCLLFLQKGKADVIKSKYFNYVEKGAKIVKTSPSTQYKLMETYPQATITVYNTGTTDLASLWADRDGLIIKANPFTANVDSFYEFYIDCGKYDIKFSGTGIASPYTYGDVFICGAISNDALNFAVGTSGTDFNVSIGGSTVTYNLPDASLINRGAVTITDQSFNGNKTFDDNIIIDSGNLQFTGSTSGRITIQPAAIAGTYTLTLPIDDGTANQVLQTDGSGILSWATVSGGGGSGTVTTFSSGNLSPLFTTSVANATTTPALTFNLSNAAANTYFGNNTGSSAAPSFVTLSATSPITITNGSGTTTLSCPTCATVGCPTCTNPYIPYLAVSGNLENSALLYGKPTSNSLDIDLPNIGDPINGPRLFFGKGNPDLNGSFTGVPNLATFSLGLVTRIGNLNGDHYAFGFHGTNNAGSASYAVLGGPGVVTLAGGVSIRAGSGYYFTSGTDPLTGTIVSIMRDAGDDFGTGPSVSNEAIEINNGTQIFLNDVTGYRDLKLRAIKLHTGTKPTCAANERGKIFYKAGGAGVADTGEICTKDAADVYAWRSLY